jgi:uncharacterized repeat protein (TIGR03843 family)
MDHEPASAIPQGLSSKATLELLRTGELVIAGRLVDASNATLYCTVKAGAVSMTCIYKPRAGERPLWDFPTGTLSRREVAAYEVSETLGWGIVPPTVWRDGPVGPGMVQQWIDVDETVDLVDLVRSDRVDLQRIAVFDVVINNADRKGGHILPTPDGLLFGIDHGVAFSVEDKVRTLLWQWEGDPVPQPVIEDLEQFARALKGGPVRDSLRALLSRVEIHAIARRVDQLLVRKRLPGPSPDWPAIPWPPF